VRTKPLLARLRVKVGTTVKVLLDTGTSLTLTIKSPGETIPENGVVSYESPIGAALLDKQEGETAIYTANNKTRYAKIIEIVN